jgi:hypothetical protein
MRKLKAKDIGPFTKILSKMEIKDTLTQMFSDTDKTTDSRAFGAKLVAGIIGNYYKAEKEFFAFLADMNDCKPEEIADMDAGEFINLVKELFGVDSLGFFKSAPKSKPQK